MKGDLTPSEISSYTDAATGARVQQVTNAPAISHPSYFLQSSFLPDGKAMFFASYRTGSPQLFEADLNGGPIRQLTDGPAIHAFSPALHPNGREIFFVRGGSV